MLLSKCLPPGGLSVAKSLPNSLRRPTSGFIRHPRSLNVSPSTFRAISKLTRRDLTPRNENESVNDIMTYEEEVGRVEHAVRSQGLIFELFLLR